MLKEPNLLHHKVYINMKRPNAPWVVFLHGFGGNSNIWKKQMDYFGDRFNIIIIDLPGHNPNPTIEEWERHYSYEKCIDMIIRIIDKYSIQKPIFIGISLGSILIHQLMKQHPERVDIAVLGGAIVQFNVLSKFLILLGHTLERLVPYMWLYSILAYIIMPKRNHKLSRSIFIREANKMGKSSFLKWFYLLHRVKSTSINIERYAIRRLYISGSEDHLFLKLLKKHIKNDPYGTLIEINNCGHVCNIERSEEFNKIAVSFIEKHTGAGRPLLERHVVDRGKEIEIYEGIK